MPVTTKIKSSPYLKTALSAASKLSVEEKQLLKLKLFSADALAELKIFEAGLRRRKKAIKKTDDEIVSITTSIRRRKYAAASKLLH